MLRYEIASLWVVAKSDSENRVSTDFLLVKFPEFTLQNESQKPSNNTRYVVIFHGTDTIDNLFAT